MSYNLAQHYLQKLPAFHALAGLKRNRVVESGSIGLNGRHRHNYNKLSCHALHKPQEQLPVWEEDKLHIQRQRRHNRSNKRQRYFLQKFQKRVWFRIDEGVGR